MHHSRPDPVIEEKAEKWRLFAALAPPENVVGPLQERWPGWRRRVTEGGVRWVKPGQIHLTLKFFGGVESPRVAGLREALRQAVGPAAPFHLQLAGWGVFPSTRRPKVLWLGVEGDLKPLLALQESIDRFTEPWAPREDRPYHPHLTVARFKASDRRLAGQVEGLMRDQGEKPGAERWVVSGVVLIRSQLTDQGSSYSLVEAFPFG